jgi:amidase
MDLWQLDALELGRMIDDRTVSSREVVQAHLDRIGEINPRVNAVVEALADRALAEADAADRALRAGERRGELHGVPFAVKSNIDLAGSATTQGVVALRNAVAEADSPHVEVLRRAGGIAIARTNMPAWGFRWHTDNALFGATVNPWDETRTPGGSGGGDAVAVATGMAPLALGNDYGGSVRYPAQACGVTSLRPTRGRIPYRLSTSPAELPFTIQLFGVPGILARRVADLATTLTMIAGSRAEDPWTVDAPLRGPPVPRRVAATFRAGSARAHPDVVSGVQRAADALADEGYEVEEVEPPDIEDAARMWAALVATEARLNPPFWHDNMDADTRTFVHAFLESAPTLDLRGYAQTLADRQAIARRWARFQQRYPIVLGPVSIEQPFEVGHDLAGQDAVDALVDAVRLVVGVGMLDLPVVVAPVGIANGLPQAVQLIAPRWREDLALAAAGVVELRLGIVTPMTPVSDRRETNNELRRRTASLRAAASP